jgi:hypothetical protein
VAVVSAMGVEMRHLLSMIFASLMFAEAHGSVVYDLPVQGRRRHNERAYQRALAGPMVRCN